MKKLLSLHSLLTIIIFFSFTENPSAKLSEEKINKKKTGWYVTGLPLLNYSSDNGLGYGARLYLYNNGSRTDKYFEKSPYCTQIYAQFFTTTEGFSFHELNLDMYNIFGTKYRVKSAFEFDRRINANFYGTGAQTTRNGLQDFYGNKYSTYDDYEHFLKSNSYQYYKYNNYQYKKPRYRLSFLGDITSSIKFLTGFEILWTDIDSWNRKKFEDEDDDTHTSGITLLDLWSNNIVGLKGGWTNAVKLGVAYDTRDYAPDPGSGLYIDYSFKLADTIFASDYEFYRSTIGARTYITLFKPLVLALRLGFTDTSGGTPFYELNNLDFLFWPQEGLGGHLTLRGYPLNRFVSETMTLGNMEFRFKFAEITPFNQRFEFKLVTFVDAGNVYDEAFDPFKDPGFNDYKFSYGGGLVIAWNLATIIHAYYGISCETSAISINFDHSI